MALFDVGGRAFLKIGLGNNASPAGVPATTMNSPPKSMSCKSK